MQKEYFSRQELLNYLLEEINRDDREYRALRESSHSTEADIREQRFISGKITAHQSLFHWIQKDYPDYPEVKLDFEPCDFVKEATLAIVLKKRGYVVFKPKQNKKTK